MHNILPTPDRRPVSVCSQPDWQSGIKRRHCYQLIAVFTLLTLLIQPACLFRKKKAAVPDAAPPAPSRVVLLPLNIPSENTDLRWVAMAAPILMAKTMETAPDLELVPVWQSMPIAAEAVGASREVTPESAAYIANRLAAKWAVEGQLSPSTNGLSLLLDFIPAKANMIAYRYQKDGVSVEALGTHYYEAVTQFLRYLVARPLGTAGAKSPDVTSYKQLAETLDLEYGWFTAADAGKAEGVVTALVRTDPKMARLLFSPSLYPAVGPVPSKPRPVELTPAPPLPVEKPAAAPAPAPGPPPPAPTPRAEAAEPQIQIVLPPPKRFVQKMAPRAAIHGEGTRIVEGAKAPPPTASPPVARKKQVAVAALSKPASSLPPQPVPPTIGSNKGFKVQVLALRRKEDAETTARTLENKGLRAEVEQADLKDRGRLYRIRLVGYESRQDAKKAAEKLISASLIQQYWIVPSN